MADSNRTLYAVFGVALLLIGAGAGYVFQNQQQQQAQITPGVDYDGSFATFQPLQEVAGYNDLSVTQQSLNSTGQVDDDNVVAKYNVNTSDGDVLRFAYGFEVDGPMESVDLDLAPASDTVASAFDIRTVSIIPDSNDELSIDDVTPVREFDAGQDDEVDATVNGLEEGDYAFVLEVRGVDTSTVSAGADLYTQDYDAQTDADSDEAEEMHVTIDNAAAQ